MVPKVLIVDDDEPARLFYARVLKRLGCWCGVAADAEQARDQLQEHDFALALVDLNMRGTSGLELIRYISHHHLDTATLMVTALDDPLIADSALELGAYGYLVKPFECNELLINVASALRRRKLEMQGREHRERLEQLIQGGNNPFRDGLDQLKGKADKIQAEDEPTILRVARIAEFRDHPAGSHIEKVGRYCALLATRLECTSEYCEQLRLASMLHDLGKVSIPDSILYKKGRLTPYEIEVMKRHAQFGHHMLMGTQSPFLQMAATVAWTHHERYDGSGYPRGLSGDSIPLEGRITAIADVFDSLTSRSAYRPGYPFERALDIIADGRGKHFDPALAELFMNFLDEVQAIQAASIPDSAPAWEASR